MGKKIQRFWMRIIRYDGNEYENDAQTMTCHYDDGEINDGI